jgi:DNA mismatch repair protein MutS2
MIPKNTLELLEFRKVLALISEFANSEASRASILGIVPLEAREDIETRLRLITEIRRLTHEGTPLSLFQFADISQHFRKLRPEGAVLEAIQLSDFMPVLQIAGGIIRTIRDRFDLPALTQLAGSLTGFPDILKTLEKSLDGEGNILDSASFLLADLRTLVRKSEIKIRKKLEEFTRDERLAPFLQDDFVTMRSGRWVIPVRMDSKGMVPGVVHDISKSGETAFIEPLSIINLSNELENLIADQKAEELRILRSLCSMIRLVIDECEGEFRTVVYIDALNSISLFADRLRMEVPTVTDAPGIHIDSARHPLLQLALGKAIAPRDVVPLDIHLSGEHTVMVITGANAGGKTIAIKTIGLIILMALSGMPVPAASSSTIPFVSNLLVDIGDEQSIENNLSTFSAHMSNISYILKNKQPDTVVLIDELGTGTDPDEGAALACAILRHIRDSGALVFATTHLSDIKGFVHRTAGMLNASMEFNLKTFTPLYRLRVGEPGQSHALDIAEQYGIPAGVIKEARSLLGNMKAELDQMIADLNSKRMAHESALRNLAEQKEEFEKKTCDLTHCLAATKEQQGEILADAYREASRIIADTKRQMNTFLDEVKKKEKAERLRVIRKVEDAREVVSEKLRALDSKDMRVPSIDEIRKGDAVFIRSLGHDAVVTDINTGNKRFRVSAGNMEIEVPFSDITLGGKKPPVSLSPRTRPDAPEEFVPLKIILVGLRVDEAISRLERFLNDASLSDLPEVVIVHGIGKGLLAKAIREHLNGHPLVKKHRSGTQGEGGAAVTLAVMR